MAKESINLLSKDLSVSSKAGKLIKTVNLLAITTGILFVVLALAGGVTIFLLNNSNNDLLSRRQSLMTQVQSLESTEQSLVIAKDRLSKIEQVLAMRTLEGRLSKQNELVRSASPGIEFKETEISGENSKLNLLSLDSISLQNLFQSISLDKESYDSVILESLQFNQFQGFNLVLQVF